MLRQIALISEEVSSGVRARFHVSGFRPAGTGYVGRLSGLECAGELDGFGRPDGAPVRDRPTPTNRRIYLWVMVIQGSVRRMSAEFATKTPDVTRAIAAIPDNAWTPVNYPARSPTPTWQEVARARAVGFDTERENSSRKRKRAETT